MISERQAWCPGSIVSVKNEFERDFPGGLGFPGCGRGKEPTLQCRRNKRHRFCPWVKKIPWRRAWQPTPVFLPAESHGQRSLTGYSPRGHKESDATEETENACMHAYVRFKKSLRLDFCLNFRN